ncbi:MAG TPA: MFS transporter [Candidatus Eisenbergiella intestinipullorum]|nr:MFS transporter [Candidatus Eisenbergiella intestinipullorum]
MNHNFKKYILFWLSGSVSQLGSAMTGYALILWSYTQTGSAMAVSMMSFCHYLPYIAVSIFAGDFVDRRSKKKIMLASDSLAALCSCMVLLLCMQGSLQMWHIYLINTGIGLMNAFQSPAQSVVVCMMVPKEKLSQASGMDSFSSNLVTVIAPVFASFFFVLGGLENVIALDLFSFLVNFTVLLLFIHLPEASKDEKAAGTTVESTGKEPAEKKRGPQGALTDMLEGFRFLRERKGLLYIMLTMALLNFFSRLTYENILSPMILARSCGDEKTLGLVNAVLGAGGILGGILVSCRRWRISPRMEIYGAAALSFLFGDLLMGLGRNGFWWCVAAVAASLPIPFITAGQRVLLYENVPLKLQGSVFGVRNAIQFGTIPVGILLGGFLADYVFEPFMQSGAPAAAWLEGMVGSGNGSGMAVMFLCTGTLGFLASVLAGRSRRVRELEEVK